VKHIINHLRQGNYWRVALLLVCLGGGAGIYAQDYSTSSTPFDHHTPSGLAPGSPAGSYPLSDFETVNPYNGNLSFRLPLVHLGGRGSAGFTSMLAIDNKKWHVRRSSFFTHGEETAVKWTPTTADWKGREVGYGPGVMVGRQSGFDTGTLSSFCTNPRLPSGVGIYRFTMTTLTFTAPDGTEYEFRDKESEGKPHEQLISNLAVLCGDPTALGASRGRVFVTTDGSAATFISDAAIYDLSRSNAVTGNRLFFPYGILKFKDGTTYRIENGFVTWIRDRNGNRVYGGADPLNRRITVTTDYQDVAPYGLSDRITFNGYGGATRVIRISKTDLGNALRSDYSLQTYPQLFPELNGLSGTIIGNHDPQVVSYVWLPDGRHYRFLYNPYGELARIELPTGGAIEYDYTPPGSSVRSGNNGTEIEWVIYRRVRERRVLPDGVNVESRTEYVLDGEAVRVDQFNSSGVRIASTKHYYLNGNLSLDSLFQKPYFKAYSGWFEGKEVAVESLRPDDLTPLRRVVYDWRQRAAVGWFDWWNQNNGPFPDRTMEPSNDPRLVSTTTVLLDTNQVSKQTAIDPSNGAVAFDQYNNQTGSWEYGFGIGEPGALIRHTRTDYLTSGYDTVVGTNIDPDAAATIHIRNLPTSQAVYSDAGTSNKVAEMTYEYDNYAASDGYHAQLVARPGITGLCDGSPQNCPGGANFADPNYTARGNVTRISHWLNTTGGAVDTYQQYDVAGNVVKAIDAKGKATTLDFIDRFGSTDDDARQNTPPAELNGQMTYAFATKVTNALGQEAYTQYDYFLGRPVNSEDANGIVGSIAYNDTLDRPTQGIQARYKVGVGIPAERRQTTFNYDDTNRVITTTSDRDTFNDNMLAGKAYYDGLGRTWRGATYEGSTWSIIDTQFGALGRVSQVSNPYRAADPDSASPPSGPWAEWTKTDYDELGRVSSVITPEGAHVDMAYIGNQVTVTDQAVKSRRSETDAFGRLIKITEDPGGLNYETYYSYDALGNLRQVTQGSQTRNFVYDSLSRLTSATNPESGTMTYAYDLNGNLIDKTDARGVKTTMAYDALNRVISKIYSGTTSEGIAAANATPPVNYFYDDYSALPSGAPSWPGTPSKGRLIGVTYGPGSEGTYYKYDAAGRIVTNHQRMGTSNYATAYFYNRAGAVTREERGIPARRRILMGYDAAGRLATMDTGSYPFLTYVPLVNNIRYTPFGGLQSETYGNGLIHSMAYNSRHQPTEIRLGRPDNLESVLRLGYIYGTASNVNGQDPEITLANNNGNVARIKYLISGAVQYTQTFQYDSLNRLSYAVEHNNGAYNDADRAWYQTFDYDRYGNRGINVANTSDNVDAANRALQLADFSMANNRITHTDFFYDAAGNLISEPGKNYTYDAENRIVTATVAGGAPSQYIYDGNGHRVKKIVGGVATRFEYGAGGELTTERNDSNSNVIKDYLYKGGELLATSKVGNSGEYEYATADHLGSPRAWTGSDGNLIMGGRHDYGPFGEELFAGVGIRSAALGYGADSTRQKFDGYERDAETGLDFAQARYFSSVQGRFTSPDIPFADQYEYDPQSWNLYAFVINNPLKYDDPLGLWKRVKTDDGREIYEAEEGDTLTSLGEVLGTSAKRVVNFFDGNTKVEQGTYYDVTALVGQLNKEEQFFDSLQKAVDNFLDGPGRGFDFQLPQQRFDPTTPFTQHYPGIDRFQPRTDDPLSPNKFAKGKHEQKKFGKLGQRKGTDALRAENKKLRDIARELGLTKDQQRRLHEEVSGQDLNYHEIMEFARSLFDK
jgi:RHS repeat-associated protein